MSTTQRTAAPSKATVKPAVKGGGNRKRIAVVAGGVALISLGGWAGLWAWGQRTPGLDASKERIVAFVATDKFADLSSDKQQAYLDKLEGDREAWRGLSDEQRRNAWENMRESRENAELDKYFKLAPADRTKFLDEQIKRDEERRKQWEERRREGSTRPSTRPGGGGERGGPGGPGGEGRPGGQGGQGGQPGQGGNQGGQRGGPGGMRNSPERQKARLETRSPERRAQSAQYRAEMSARRAALGLPSGGRGPGGR